MTTAEHVAALKELDRLFAIALASDDAEDWRRYNEALWAYQRQVAA